jgi:ribosome-binding factor A
MSYQRIERISEEIKKKISRIIRDEVKDPRIARMASITRVEVTKDLHYAKVYISVLGSDKEKNDTIEGLTKASGYIRKQLGRELQIRYIPELHFILDTSIEYSIEIAKKINEIKKDWENSDEDK